MDYMLQSKDIGWLNEYKNNTHIYIVYKTLTSDLKPHAGRKWRDGKRHSMQMEIQRWGSNIYIRQNTLKQRL